MIYLPENVNIDNYLYFIPEHFQGSQWCSNVWIVLEYITTRLSFIKIHFKPQELVRLLKA